MSAPSPWSVRDLFATNTSLKNLVVKGTKGQFTYKEDPEPSLVVTSTTKVSTLDLKAAGGDGAQAALRLDPWEGRTGGAPVVLAGVDNGLGSGFLTFKFSETDNSTSTAVPRARMDHLGLTLGADASAMAPLDVRGVAKVRSLRYEMTGLNPDLGPYPQPEIVQFFFQKTNVSTNPDQTVELSSKLAAAGVPDDVRCILDVRYMTVHITDHNINDQEYTAGTNMLWKVSREGDGKLWLTTKHVTGGLDEYIHYWVTCSRVPIGDVLA